ncbi:MAG: Zn-ribbon domain-containing OB-fold protein [Candidatus Bathyarchaeota archaeon]|nr:Zn-ribbon domain-containing OB-fold protein [Candidatus Bathyarchaeota archaeon]
MSVPRYWRETKYRYRLVGEMCTECGNVVFPRGAVCSGCGSSDLEEVNLRETGKVVTWTVVRNPPAGYEKYSPFVVGLVELDDGVRVLSQIVDVELDEVETGMRVEAAFRRVKEDGPSGIIEYGYKFRPVIE